MNPVAHLRRVAVCAILATFLLLGACSTQSGSRNVPDFYRSPTPIPAGAPGSIVRVEPMTPPSSESMAWRIMYTSRAASGAPIVVTGMVIAPEGPAPATGRPVVAWAHPTTGIADACAPSLQQKPYDAVMGLAQFLARGWVVVATDYEGLGADGPHPYLIGESEARSVLDSVRAAHNLGDAHASTRFGVFGHSQGGQAALFTGQLAATYAPDLTLSAVVAAAPSGDLRAQFDLAADTEAYSYIGSYMTVSWADTEGTDPATAVAPDATDEVRRLATTCVVGGSTQADAALVRTFDDDPEVSPSLWRRGFTATEPWSATMAANSPGSMPIPVPTLITQGTADKVILPATTADLVARYRSNGSAVTEQMLEGVPHTLVGLKSVPYVVQLFATAFD